MPKKPLQIGILGVSFNTLNLGVLALSESSIKAILTHWPDAKIRLLGTKAPVPAYDINVNKKNLHLEVWPISFSKNIFVANHFLVLLLYAFMMKLVPARKLRNFFCHRNPYLKAFMDTDVVMDITGGDSFSDIYGMYKFTMDFCRKWLVLQLGKPLVLLPQTYGPFQTRWARIMARYILMNARQIYARDSVSKNVAEQILNPRQPDIENVPIVPDVAFLLDKQKPAGAEVDVLIDQLQLQDRITVGINVSGLLFNGGYTRNNDFGLQTEYKELIRRVVEYFLTKENVHILFIPHLFDEKTNNIESDSFACQQIFNSFTETDQNRLHVLQGVYDHKEMKYFISLTDFFIGSRMHTCIGALSQGIPAVGLAYSRKFLGVFETVGMQRYVVNLTYKSYDEILREICHCFNHRDRAIQNLQNTVPNAQTQILDAFRTMCYGKGK